MILNRPAIAPDLMLRLLECTSSSLYAILKENSIYLRICPDSLRGQITSTRNNLYKTLTSSQFTDHIPIIKEIITLDETTFKKSMMIMMHVGLDHKLIADLLCINKTFTALTEEKIIEEYPEIFK